MLGTQNFCCLESKISLQGCCQSNNGKLFARKGNEFVLGISISILFRVFSGIIFLLAMQLGADYISGCNDFITNISKSTSR